MKFFLVFASLVLAISASTDEELWMKFKQDHSKTYKSLREDKLRFEVFKSNLRTIEEHNAKYEKGEETWFMGTNQFSDLTNEEFKSQYLTYKQPKIEFTHNFTAPEGFTAPDSIDWRDKGVVLSVKNQGQCGSCWAFSAVGALEGQNAIKHDIKEDLSEQELVDCAKDRYDNAGCDGGLMDNAFNYVKDHGLSKLSDYPYVGKVQTCRSSSNTAGIRVTGYTDIAHTEAQLKEAVASVGPVSVAIDGEHIQHYSGGIFNNFFCGYHLNHAVLAVGYGKDNNHEYWIVKNSWGTSWGEKGYIKMTRNRFNQCGIASSPSYPNLA